ncbi:aggrecan core protein-like isoform X2 [Mizuhopecten yessoensis]|uniref:Hepatic lectin n=1 Tax=Mizuhopecten yessoensis TaxID=6573 RepID=A0A210PV54_MIZYE|nr:aggrecan core protein-like isoform X2 [Mizuhopecten yessoensis]OWF40377.1 Hepatic lectin [Mizuhopecten yessoensis]
MIETFLNLFLCYSSLQCNRIPYYSPKSYVESTVIGNSRQYTFRFCNDTVELPKVYLNDVCRCVPERFYSIFMVIKDEIRKGRFNGFKMDCTQVFNTTDDSSTTPQNAAPSKISTALAQLLRLRGVSPLQIARIQATGLSEAELEGLRARRKLTMAEIAFMQTRGVPIQQINAFQRMGLLPSEIRALRARGRLPRVSPGIPRTPFLARANTSPPGSLPQVTPIRPLSFPRVVPPRIGRGVAPRGTGRRIIGTPIVTPIRPLGVRGSQGIVPQAVRRITKFQELQLLSRQLSPLQLVLLVRGMTKEGLVSLATEMTANQFAAMWKVLTKAQKQQLLPSLTSQMRDRLTSTQTSQESLRAFQNQLTPSQIMQLSPEQIQRLGAVLASMDGDKSQLPKGLLPSSNGDTTPGTGLHFRQINPTTTVIRTGPSTTDNTVFSGEGPSAPAIGTIVIPGDNVVGGDGSVPSTGTGTLTPVNNDSGAEKMIRFDVVPTEAGDSQFNKGNIVEGMSPIDTSGTVVDIGDQNVPNPPSPDLQLTSGSLVIDSPTVDALYQASVGGSIAGTSESGSSNTAMTGDTGNTYADGKTPDAGMDTISPTVDASYQASAGGSIVGTSESGSSNTAMTGDTGNTYADGISPDAGMDTTNIIPNYKRFPETEMFSSGMCSACENSAGELPCYLPHPGYCNKFIQCVPASGSELRPQTMNCYDFLFWDQGIRSCIPTSEHCTMPTGVENLPKEGVIEAPVEYDSTPPQQAVETTTTTPTVDPSTEPPPDYAPFERVQATLDMSLYPAPPSGLVFPDGAPSNLEFPDINTGPNRIVAADEPFNMEVPETTASSTPATVNTSPTPVPVKAPPAEVCEVGWVGFERDCYFLSSDQLTWHSALTQCHNMDAHLARIYTTAENKFIQKTARNRKGGPYEGYWIGGSDIRTEGVWEWYETGKQLGPVFWHQSEPNSFQGDQDCLQLFVHHAFQWDDEVCTHERHYVCEKSAKFD